MAGDSIGLYSTVGLRLEDNRSSRHTFRVNGFSWLLPPPYNSFPVLNLYVYSTLNKGPMCIYVYTHTNIHTYVRIVRTYVRTYIHTYIYM